jgi:hypothetical protein
MMTAMTLAVAVQPEGRPLKTAAVARNLATQLSMKLVTAEYGLMSCIVESVAKRRFPI